MRVLFLQGQPCMRALKYAAGLRRIAPDLELGFAFQGRTLTEWYGAGDELFDSLWRLRPNGDADLGRVVDEFAPDIIHSHNLPDSLTVLALGVADGVPVIHDAHDLYSLRRTPYEDGLPEPQDPVELEKRAIEGSDALITVSDEMTEEIHARHTPPARIEVFANYALARDLPPQFPAREKALNGRTPRIVYQGTLSTNGGHYDLRDIFHAVVDAGATLDVYPSRPSPEYRELADETPGIRCHGTLPPGRLLRELARYDFGWAGFNGALNGAHLDTALPNKLFDYLGAGLPVLTLRHRALRRVVESEGVGLSLDAVDGLRERLAALDIASVRRRIAEVRHRLTVEANIGRIADLYADVTAACARSGSTTR
jgi:glycosyltransferase involved in cell wall biosynthesis